MKFLFVGSIQGESTSQYYFWSLLQLGHSAINFDPQVFQVRGLFDWVSLRVKKQPGAAQVVRANERLASILATNHFDAVFVMGENYIEPSVIEASRKKNHRPIWIYHSHDNNFASGVLKPPAFFKTLCLYDFVFTTKSQNVSRYQGLGQHHSYYIPSAFEPSVHRSIPLEESIWGSKHLKVTFVGTYDQSRDEYFDGIDWELLHVWGSHWQRSKHFANRRDRIFPSPIYYFELADVISHSEISLGILRTEVEDRHTQRTFEIPACGGFQLAPRNDEILSFFKEDEEIACFSDAGEMKEKILYYLKHRSHREKISKKGHERCLRDGHSYLDRTKTILTRALVRNKVLSWNTASGENHHD